MSEELFNADPCKDLLESVARHPYTYTLKYGGLFRLWPVWKVLYEDTPVFIYRSSESEVKELTAMMNCAWAEGYRHGKLVSYYMEKSNAKSQKSF